MPLSISPILYMWFYPHEEWDENSSDHCFCSFYPFIYLFIYFKQSMREKQSRVMVRSLSAFVPLVLLLYQSMRVTEYNFPEAGLKVVSFWNWPKQELREKNWSAMEALSSTESILQQKLSKAVKVRQPPSVCFTSSNLKWSSEISFSTIIHNKTAYSFAHCILPLAPPPIWPQVLYRLFIELLLLNFAAPLGNLRLI